MSVRPDHEQQPAAGRGPSRGASIAQPDQRQGRQAEIDRRRPADPTGRPPVPSEQHGSAPPPSNGAPPACRQRRSAGHPRPAPSTASTGAARAASATRRRRRCGAVRPRPFAGHQRRPRPAPAADERASRRPDDRDRDRQPAPEPESDALPERRIERSASRRAVAPLAPLELGAALSRRCSSAKSGQLHRDEDELGVGQLPEQEVADAAARRWCGSEDRGPAGPAVLERAGEQVLVDRRADRAGRPAPRSASRRAASAISRRLP